MSKKDQAQRIYNESVRKGFTRQQIIEEFMYRLQMTQAGASTYFYNCQKAAKPAGFSGSTKKDGSAEKVDELFRRAQAEQRRREQAAREAAEAAARARRTQEDFASFQRAYANFFNQNFRKAAGSQEQAKPKVEIKAVHWTILLEVKTDASKEEITKAYRAKAMHNHQNGNDQDKLKALNIAKDEAMKRFK